MRKRLSEMESSLSARKQREQTLSSTIKLGYWEWDEIKQYPRYLSEEFATIFGLSQEQLYEIYQCEEDLYRFIHPDDLERYKQQVLISAKDKSTDKQARVHNYRIVRPGGEVRFVREINIGIVEHDGVLLRSYGAIQDTTEYHRSLIESRKSEERYGSLFSKLPIGVQEQDWSSIKKSVDKLQSEGVEDLKGYLKNNPAILKNLVDTIQITSVNDAMLKIYGAETREELVHDEEDVADWWDERWAELYASEITALAGPSRINYAELTETRVDQSNFETRLITSIVKGDEDTWQRVLTIIEDVTERKQNEVALIRAKDSAEQASRAKSEFLATMSHEIRTPINGVLGMTELLMGADLDMHSRRLATTAHRSAESLLDIINDILDFSKIEAEKMELSEAGFDLRQVLEDVLEMIAGQAHRKGLKCIANLPPDLPRLVRGDAVRLRQIMVNILGNATKFTEHGEIRLLAKVEARSVDKYHMVFEISDTGPGIPLEQQENIFNAFSQVDSTTTRRFGGTGLGLAITLRLLDLMGGQIELESAPGRGTLFRLKIPLAVGNNENSQPKSPEALVNLRILIVDDHAINRDILSNQVIAWGMRYDNVESGIRAIELVRKAQTENDPYRIVLLDWHMPDMDGLELARTLSTDPTIHTPQLIMLSSTGFDPNSETAKKASITCYLQKPVRQKLLLDCLCGVIGEEQSSGTTEAGQAHRFDCKILLAEDNLVNQEVALGMLRALSCQVDLAENGEEAVIAAKAKRYDLILMDCHMPEMNGFTASQQIRDDEKQQGISRIPIVALTADIKKGIEVECGEAGMDGYLSKPFSQAKLSALLSQWLTPTAEASSSTAEQSPHDVLEKRLDTDVLAQLRQLSSTTGRDILGKSVRFFLQQTPEDIIRLHQSVAQNDYESVRTIAHSLKSSSANLGAMTLSQLFQRLEDRAHDECAEVISELLPAIDALLPEVLYELRQEIDIDKESIANLPEEKQLPQATSAPSILLIDDDAGFRLTTSEALKATGFSVREASDGELALSELDQSIPDLILLDAIMPGIDGFEVCEQIRKRSDTRNIPVIILTGLGDMESVNRAFQSGATDFIVKPINYAVLSSRIRFQLRVADNLMELDISRGWLANAQRISGIGYWQWDSSTDKIEISEQLAEMLAIGDISSINSLTDYINLIHPQDQEFIRSNILTACQSGEASSEDYRLLTLHSETLVVHQELARPENSGDIVLGTVQNITQQRESEKMIRQLAYSDALTGLANRAYFYKHLEDVIKASHRRNERFAILFLDLDEFKEINDSLGHDAGDILLKQIAQHLKKAVREVDFVARLGGDEFCIVSCDISDQYDAAYIANRCLEEINVPVDLGKQVVRPRCSIGIAYFPDDGDDSRSLMKAADSAMYAAKESGKHRYVFYQPDFTRQAEERLQIEQDLRLSIDKKELVLHYQPQVDLRTGRMMGIEALVRWNHPTRGMILPQEFIDIAERIGFIKPLGHWVLETACQQAIAWNKAGLPHFKLAVNICSSHFQDSGFIKMVEKILADSGFPGSSLEFEVTESVTHPVRKNVSTFDHLQKMGIKLAIDNFGTGYSSLASLMQLPIDSLKIDRLFIADMLQDPKSSMLLGTIVGVAHALGHIVVADGLEQEDQVKVLNAIGCDVIQGDFFSKPVPADEILNLALTDFLSANIPVKTTSSQLKLKTL